MSPTMSTPLVAIGRALATVFRQWRYIVLTVTVAMLLFLLVAWIRNFWFLWYVFTTPAFSWGTRFSLLSGTFAMFRLNTTLPRLVLSVTLVVLAGINVSLLVFYLKRRLTQAGGVGTSLLGTVLGVLGIGCASCGSVILTLLIGFSATASFLGLLPLRGAEFGLAGVTLLLGSIYLTAKKINNPVLCKI